MTGQLPNLASGCDPDNLELVWENGQILIRGLSSNTTKKSFPSSGYFSQSSKDGFNVVLEPDKKRYDKPLEDVSIVPLNKFKGFNQSSVSKLEEEIPQHSDSEVPRSSLKQYEASIKFMRSKEKKSRVDEKIDCVNFSIFLRPPALLKSNHPSSGATRPPSSPGLAGAEDLEGNARSASRSVSPLGKEGNFMARNMKPILLDSEPQKESLPDEQSAAVGYKDTTSNTRFPKKIDDTSSGLLPAIKENSGNKKSVEQMVESSSVCSRGASNCPTYISERRYEDIDLSKTAMEESESTKKAASARGSKDAKRKRKAQVHNLSERRRRDKIKKKMRALQELIPNCNKVDKASMLDEAIEYLRTLQLQVQMLSMGTGVYMPPMMLPSAMQHLNARARHLAGYSPMAVGMSLMRMQMGLGCSPAQFPTSLMSGAAALPGTTGARLNTLGFPSHCSQMLLMSMSRSPFVSLAGRFFPPSVQSPGISQAAAAQVELSKDSNPTLQLKK